MFLGIFTGVKKSLDLVACKVMCVSGLQTISLPLMVTAFPTVPTYGLGFLLNTAWGPLRPSCQSWLILKLIVHPFLCPSLSSVPCVRLYKEASGNYQYTGFQGWGMKVVHPSPRSAVPWRCCHLTGGAAAWHLGAHFSSPLSYKWWETCQGEQLTGIIPRPGSIMKWSFVLTR